MSNNIPRYAAGDAMDRINTGQEVPFHNDNHDGWKFIIFIISVCIILRCGYLYMDSDLPQTGVQGYPTQNNENTGFDGSSDTTSSAQTEPLSGSSSLNSLHHELVNDDTELYVKLSLTNNTNYYLTSATITYTVTYPDGSVLAKKEKELQSLHVEPGDSYEFDEIISFPEKASDQISIEYGGNCKYQSY